MALRVLTCNSGFIRQIVYPENPVIYAVICLLLKRFDLKSFVLILVQMAPAQLVDAHGFSTPGFLETLS